MPKTSVAELISPDYLRQNQMLHEGEEGFGGSGHKHFGRVADYCKELKTIRTILDYGCGERTLRRKMRKKKFHAQLFEYDPAVKGLHHLPKFPVDLVVSTDVLEHIEPDKIDAVIKHICALTKQAAYLVIATRPANKILPDGRNAHLIIEDTPWWLARLEQADWRIDRYEDQRKKDGSPHELRVWIRK